MLRFLEILRALECEAAHQPLPVLGDCRSQAKEEEVPNGRSCSQVVQVHGTAVHLHGGKK